MVNFMMKYAFLAPLLVTLVYARAFTFFCDKRRELVGYVICIMISIVWSNVVANHSALWACLNFLPSEREIV